MGIGRQHPEIAIGGIGAIEIGGDDGMYTSG
jgi:hypothetical protein